MVVISATPFSLLGIVVTGLTPYGGLLVGHVSVVSHMSAATGVSLLHVSTFVLIQHIPFKQIKSFGSRYSLPPPPLLPPGLDSGLTADICF